MKKLHVFSLLALGGALALSSCNNSNRVTPTHATDLLSFLEARHVDVSNINLDWASRLKPAEGVEILKTEIYDTFEHYDDNGKLSLAVPYFYIDFKGDLLDYICDGLEAAEFTVTHIGENENGYEEAHDKDKLFDVYVKYNAADVAKSVEENTEFTLYVSNDYKAYYGDPDAGKTFYDVTSWPTEEITAFLATRGVANFIVPSIELTEADFDKVYSTDGSDGYIPTFAIQLNGDFAAAIASALITASWSVPTEASFYGYECFDPNELVELDYLVEEGKTYINIYAYEDVYDEDDPEEEGITHYDNISSWPSDIISAFLATRSVTTVTVPGFTFDATKVLDCYTSDGSDDYAPMFFIGFSSDYSEDIKEALIGASWNVPETPTEYGFECLDPTGLVELDYLFNETSELPFTICIYAFADIDEGGEIDPPGEDVPYDWPATAISSFLEGRGVTGVTVPNISLMTSEVVKAYLDEGDEDVSPSYNVVLKNDRSEDMIAALTAASWVDHSADYNNVLGCYVDPDNLVEIDFMMSTEFCISVYAVADLHPGGEDTPTTVDWPTEEIASFLEGRGVTGVTVPGFELNSAEIISMEIDPGDDQYSPCYYIVLSTDHSSDMLKALQDAQWEYGTTETEYGFENFDPEHKVELDYSYSDEGGFCIYIYAYADVVTELFEVTENDDGTKTVTLSYYAKYADAEALEDEEESTTGVKIDVDKGSNSNVPKYYETGEAGRFYGGNTITITSPTTITKIEFEFGSGDGSNEITANKGSYSEGVWTGSATSVTFTIGGTKGHRRISTIAVTIA